MDGGLGHCNRARSRGELAYTVDSASASCTVVRNHNDGLQLSGERAKIGPSNHNDFAASCRQCGDSVLQC